MMESSGYQQVKAGPSTEALPRATNERDKFRASLLALLKVLSSLGLFLLFYGAIRHLLRGVKIPNIPDWKAPGIPDVGGQGWKNGDETTYLLGVGKADITG